MIAIQKSIFVNWMIEKAGMAIASTTSVMYVMQENWSAMHSRIIDVIFLQ